MAEPEPITAVKFYATAQRPGGRGVVWIPEGLSHYGLRWKRPLTAALIAAMICFVWQSIIVQAHFHTRSEVVSAIATGNGVALAAVQKNQPNPDDPANCPICQERAHTGAYLLPDLIVFDPSRTVHIWMNALPLSASDLGRRSHSWQSRAPPIYLQA